MRPVLPLAATMAMLLCAIASPALGDSAPKVPFELEVPAGNKLFFHAWAVGMQMYISNQLPDGTWVWTFRGPMAWLFDRDFNLVGTHYPTQTGPTFPVWEDESGGQVIGQRVAERTVDPTAIPWLLLEEGGTSGSGPLAQTTYIQRVNTRGGLAPPTPPNAFGQEANVFYTAEYYFFTSK